MKITVIGGTGLVGAKLVTELTRQGHEAVAASRATNVDTLSGKGLDAAFEGTQVVVDASNPGYSDAARMRRFFERSGENLMPAERKAGVAHHVVLSAVGTRRLNSGYFDAKAAQEDIVVGSGLPFTIVRSTPFFEYVYAIVDAVSDGRTVRVPPLLMQPIAAEDVASALSFAALGAPVGGVIEIAGPDKYGLPELAEAILTANEDPRTIMTDADVP